MVNSNLETVQPDAHELALNFQVTFREISRLMDQTRDVTWLESVATSADDMGLERPEKGTNEAYWWAACEYLRRQGGCSSLVPGEVCVVDESKACDKHDGACWRSWKVKPVVDPPYDMVDTLFSISIALLCELPQTES